MNPVNLSVVLVRWLLSGTTPPESNSTTSSPKHTVGFGEVVVLCELVAFGGVVPPTGHRMLEVNS